jgi:hypothetical protein
MVLLTEIQRVIEPGKVRVFECAKYAKLKFLPKTYCSLYVPPPLGGTCGPESETFLCCVGFWIDGRRITVVI